MSCFPLSAPGRQQTGIIKWIKSYFSGLREVLDRLITRIVTLSASHTEYINDYYFNDVAVKKCFFEKEFKTVTEDNNSQEGNGALCFCFQAESLPRLAELHFSHPGFLLGCSNNFLHLPLLLLVSSSRGR